VWVCVGAWVCSLCDAPRKRVREYMYLLKGLIFFTQTRAQFHKLVRIRGHIWFASRGTTTSPCECIQFSTSRRMFRTGGSTRWCTIFLLPLCLLLVLLVPVPLVSSASVPGGGGNTSFFNFNKLSKTSSSCKKTTTSIVLL